MKEGYDLVITGLEEKSMVDDFGCGVMEYTRPSYEMEEVPSTDWVDEEGEDFIFPEGGLKGKAGDLGVKLCYAGKAGSWPGVCSKMLLFLKSSVLVLNDTYSGEVYRPCYFKSMSNVDLYTDPTAGDVVTFSITFRVTNLSSNGQN